MTKKRFSRSLYEMCDGPAKKALVKLLTNRGHTILNDRETYNADIISKKDGYVYCNECEMKISWKKGTDWPEHWAEVRIPERKKRLLDVHENEVLNFYVFRADLKVAWRIKDTALTEDRIKGARGRYIKPGEKFFHIPVEDAELVTVKVKK